jgi:hypothetical protein
MHATSASNCLTEDTSGNCVTCPANLYGPTCSSRCICKWGTCSNGTQASGLCIGNCSRPNFATPRCETCVAGWWGSVCQNACVDCGPNGRCDSGADGTGRCICNSGWNGSHCDSKQLNTTAGSPPTTTRAATTIVTETPASPSTTPNRTQAPANTPYLTLPPQRIVALTLTFLASVSDGRVAAAAAEVAGLRSVATVLVWAPNQTTSANLVRNVAFTTGGTYTDQETQYQYARLLYAFRSEPLNALAQLGMTTYREVTATNSPATTLAPSTHVVTAPEMDEGDKHGFPVYGIVLVALAIILFVSLGALAAWYAYTRRLAVQEHKTRRDRENAYRLQQLAASRAAGEAAPFTTANTDLDDPRRVTFLRADAEEALPAPTVTAEHEFAVTHAPRSYSPAESEEAFELELKQHKQERSDQTPVRCMASPALADGGEVTESAHLQSSGRPVHNDDDDDGTNFDETPRPYLGPRIELSSDDD